MFMYDLSQSITYTIKGIQAQQHTHLFIFLEGEFAGPFEKTINARFLFFFFAEMGTCIIFLQKVDLAFKVSKFRPMCAQLCNEKLA